MALGCGNSCALAFSVMQTLAQVFTRHSQVVQRRMQWLSAVMDNDIERLQKLLESTKLGGTDVDGGTSVANSRDALSLARAGPCAGYEDLVCIQELDTFLPKFSSCSSAEDVKAVWAETAEMRKLYKVRATECCVLCSIQNRTISFCANTCCKASQ